MVDWKERMERIKKANSSSDNQSRDRPSKCDRCGRKMSRESRFETSSGSIVCYHCKRVNNIGG